MKPRISSYGYSGFPFHQNWLLHKGHRYVSGDIKIPSTLFTLLSCVVFKLFPSAVVPDTSRFHVKFLRLAFFAFLSSSDICDSDFLIPCSLGGLDSYKRAYTQEKQRESPLPSSQPRINFWPGARFSKVPKHFGRISGDIIFFVSPNSPRASRGTKVYNYLNFLYNIWKDQLYRISRSEF